MSETMLMILEVSFDILYLLIIWTMVVIMFKRRRNHPKPETSIWLAGFFLLAFGDTGHVGFRVAAYALGDISSALTIGSSSIILVGIGSLATAYTITVLYMLLMEAWASRNEVKKGMTYKVVMLLGIARMIIMIFPGNAWNSMYTPYTWSLLRNTPLTIMGIIIAVSFLRSGKKHSDVFQKRLAWCIFVSFGFYLPVILFVRFIPMLGMLMMPKTVAYLFMAGYALKEVFPNSQKSSLS